MQYNLRVNECHEHPVLQLVQTKTLPVSLKNPKHVPILTEKCNFNNNSNNNI